MMSEISKIAQYSLDDIEPGLTKKFRVKVTESLVNEFAKITGDYSPIHMEEAYAGTTKFKQRISHGMLVGSFFSRLVGMHLPGKNGVLLSYSIKHLLPCFLDQEIVVEGIVTEKSTSTRIITLKATVTDSSGKTLINGILKVFVSE
jgi:3-hydroxybutyryl-CoA dehydratase